MDFAQYRIARGMAESVIQLFEVIHVEQSSVQRITEGTVELLQKSGRIDLPNDAVIVCAGGVLPSALLQKLGIEVETKYGQA